MKKALFWLGILLGLQIVIALTLYASNQSQDQTESRPLLSAGTLPERLVIDDGKHRADVAKVNGEWRLPDLDNLPANTSKIEGLLSKLKQTQTRWPQTTTASSHKRFEVAPEQFQRHVSLWQDGSKSVEFYLGTSPGYRQTHLRRADETAVYSVPLQNYDFSSQNEDWLDKRLIAVSAITELNGPDYHLRKTDSDWHLADAGEDELDPDRVQALIRSLENLRVQGIADKPEGDAELVLSVRAGNSDYEFRFWKNGDDHVIQRSDRAQTFTVSKYDYELLIEATRESLLRKPEAENGAG